MSEQTDKIKKSLSYSIVDGVFFTVMLGCGERFFIPFALMLGANYFEIGLTVSLPILVGSLSQFVSLHLLEKVSSRKKIVTRGVFLQALTLLPIMLLYFISDHQVPLFIFLYILYFVSGHIISPAWNSWMGDLVDLQSRGSYFGRRNKIMETSTLITFVLAGSFLHLMKGKGNETLGFLVLFAIALIGRLISHHFLNKKYEPYFEVKSESKFTFIQFLQKITTTNFGHFVFFSVLMNFSFYVSAPYFTPYMLQDLHFSYFQYMIINACSMGSRLIFMPIWGRYSDRYGTRKILILSASFLPLTVLLWLFSNNFYFIAFLHVMAGFVWSGFDLSSFTFILDSTSSEKRARCVAYYNVLNGIFILLGSLLGSLLIKFQIFHAPFVFTAFFGSFILRTLFAAIFLPQLKEVRKVDPISYPKLFTYIILRPLKKVSGF